MCDNIKERSCSSYLMWSASNHLNTECLWLSLGNYVYFFFLIRYTVDLLNLLYFMTSLASYPLLIRYSAIHFLKRNISISFHLLYFTISPSLHKLNFLWSNLFTILIGVFITFTNNCDNRFPKQISIRKSWE